MNSNARSTEYMDTLFIDYLTVCEADLSPTTLASYKTAFVSFSQYLEEYDLSLAEITQPQVQGYILANQKLASSTLQTRIKAVKAAFGYARNCTLAIQRYDDPFVRLRYPKTPDAPPVTYSDDEMRQLFEAIETEREWLCFHLFAYAGLRRAEACNLQWQDIDFQGKMLTVVEGKGNKQRRVPLHPKLQEALAECRKDSGYVLPTLRHGHNGKAPGTKLDPDGLWRTNDQWYRRAGIQKGNHAFRRTMNSVLKERGVSHEDREQIMGWAARDVQGRHYTRYLDKTLHEAICRLNYKLDRKKPKLQLVTEEVVRQALVEAGAISA